MSKEYPLYPELPEAAAQEAQELMDKFKGLMKKAAEEVLGELYADVAIYIESDSWTNFRNQLMHGFRNYNNRKIQAEYEFREIRQQIYKEYRDEIIGDLNQDLLKKIEELEGQVKWLQELRKEYGG